MKRIIIGIVIAAAAWTSADAKGGKGAVAIPPNYDYSREAKPGYIKDYCEDSIGNHVDCAARDSKSNGAYAATYQGR